MCLHVLYGIRPCFSGFFHLCIFWMMRLRCTGTFSQYVILVQKLGVGRGEAGWGACIKTKIFYNISLDFGPRILNSERMHCMEARWNIFPCGKCHSLFNSTNCGYKRLRFLHFFSINWESLENGVPCDGVFMLLSIHAFISGVFMFINFPRWREGGALHASGAALPAAQQQAPGPRGGDCRHAAVGGAGVAEIRGGVQGHDRHQPRHGEASASLLQQEVALSTVSRAGVAPNPDTAGIRLFLLACDMSNLTYYPQGRLLSSTLFGPKLLCHDEVG